MIRPRLILQLAAFLTALTGSALGQTRTVAMTVDDLPFASGSPAHAGPGDAKRAATVNSAILRAFTRYHIPATGFVIEQTAESLGLQASTNILAEWTRPGFDLGNRFYSHPDVNSLSVEQIEDEIMRGEETIAPLLANVSRKPGFLRFPYNHTGDTQEKHDAIAAFIAARGYQLAPCTIDTSDYEFNAAYVLARARHDTRKAAEIRSAYLAYSGAEIDYYTALNKQVFGYEPPHIMLLHDSSLNADSIEKVVDLLLKRGFSFLNLSKTERDRAYSVPETYVTAYSPMWGYRWAQELHVKVDGRNEPAPPAWVAEYARNPLSSK